MSWPNFASVCLPSARPACRRTTCRSCADAARAAWPRPRRRLRGAPTLSAAASPSASPGGSVRGAGRSRPQRDPERAALGLCTRCGKATAAKARRLTAKAPVPVRRRVCGPSERDDDTIDQLGAMVACAFSVASMAPRTFARVSACHDVVDAPGGLGSPPSARYILECANPSLTCPRANGFPSDSYAA